MSDRLDMERLGAQLQRLYELPRDWDTHGSPPPDERTRDAVLWAALVLSPGRGHPDVVPLSSGGVSLEWAADDLEVEIRADGKIDVWFGGVTFSGPSWMTRIEVVR